MAFYYIRRVFCDRLARVMDKARKEALDKNLLYEIVRFVIIGAYSTLIDFAIEGWITSMVAPRISGWSAIPSFFVIFLISVVGFIVSTPANWSLTAIWGFRNVEKEAEKKARSWKGALWFLFYSALGLLLGAVIHFFAYMICLEWSPLHINILGGFNFQSMFVEGHMDVFWAWLIVMVIRTSFTLVFNYLTRKFILFKAPKEETTK